MYQYRDPLPVEALILAGGKATRFGGLDKGLIEYQGRPMILSSIYCLRKQVERIVISANRNLESYAGFGLPVLRDDLPDFPGPLAGIASAMKQCAQPYLLIVPCDTPEIPDDLAVRLYYALARSGADLALVHDGDQAHYLHAMLATRLLPDLEKQLADGKLSVQKWYAGLRVLEVDFSDHKHCFHNINAPQDMPQ